jgi:hypothetical protein
MAGQRVAADDILPMSQASGKTHQLPSVKVTNRIGTEIFVGRVTVTEG